MSRSWGAKFALTKCGSVAFGVVGASEFGTYRRIRLNICVCRVSAESPTIEFHNRLVARPALRGTARHCTGFLAMRVVSCGILAESPAGTGLFLSLL